MIYFQLFYSFFKVGICSIGGGYSAIYIIEDIVINQFSWFSSAEFNNLITLSEMTPGPLTLNFATFIGMQVGGVLGAIIATIACVIPGFVIIILLSMILKKIKNQHFIKEILKHLRPLILTFIFLAIITIISSFIFVDNIISFQNLNFIAIGIIILCVALQFIKIKRNYKIFEFGPLSILLISGILGLIIYL